jgi:hypothetical protein
MKRVVFITAVLLVASGCSATLRPTPKLPNASTLVREQMVIHSDFRLPKSHRLVDELVALRTDIARELGTPLSDEPIHLFLFESRERYEQFVRTTFPHLPDRRAWFVETDTQLSVFAFWGHHVADDLRHEASHGYLHSFSPNIPLWLDEGLAEYFEVPRSQQGMNQPHIDQLAKAYNDGSWAPDLERLERMRDPDEMGGQDYAECWAWVRFLLDSTPERRELTQNYLARLRMSSKVKPLSEFLGDEEPHASKEMLAYLRELAAERR